MKGISVNSGLHALKDDFIRLAVCFVDHNIPLTVHDFLVNAIKTCQNFENHLKNYNIVLCFP